MKTFSILVLTSISIISLVSSLSASVALNEDSESELLTPKPETIKRYAYDRATLLKLRDHPLSQRPLENEDYIKELGISIKLNN